jgi:pimeloyl-ACP methyl ester carboxylesterase
MKSHFLYEKSRIAYQSTGTGPQVLLLHGFGESGFVWESLAEKLSDEYSVLVPDLPGTGGSDLISDMSMEGQARCVQQVAVWLGWERYVLIGHSMGGYISLAGSELFSETLLGLGLFHSTAFPDSEEKKATRRKGIDFIRAHGAQAFLETSSPNLFAPSTRDENPELIDEFLSRLDNFSPETLVSCYEAMMARPDRRQQLISSSFPIMIVLGKYDQAIPLEDGLKLCSLPKKAYIHILSQSGHMGMLEEPQKSEESIREFLKDCWDSYPMHS